MLSSTLTDFFDTAESVLVGCTLSLLGFQIADFHLQSHFFSATRLRINVISIVSSFRLYPLLSLAPVPFPPPQRIRRRKLRGRDGSSPPRNGMATIRLHHLHQDLLRNRSKGAQLAWFEQEAFGRGIELLIEEVGFGLR